MKEPDIISDMKELNQQHNLLVEKLKQQQQHASNNTNSNNTNGSNNGSSAPLNGTMNIKSELPSYKFPPNVNVLKCNNQIKELHTVIRDK